MSDLTDMERIFKAQNKRQMKKKRAIDWEPVVFVREHSDTGWDLTCDEEEIGFAFNKDGRLVGMWNWQD